MPSQQGASQRACLSGLRMLLLLLLLWVLSQDRRRSIWRQRPHWERKQGGASLSSGKNALEKFSIREKILTMVEFDQMTFGHGAGLRQVDWSSIRVVYCVNIYLRFWRGIRVEDCGKGYIYIYMWLFLCLLWLIRKALSWSDWLRENGREGGEIVIIICCFHVVWFWR